MERIKTISVDFDGVVAEYSVWLGYSHIGKPVAGVREALEDLKSKGFRIVLHTTRLNPFPHETNTLERTVTSGEARSHIVTWLEKHKLRHYFDEITGFKPLADFYIDDRGVRFEGNWGTVLERVSR